MIDTDSKVRDAVSERDRARIITRDGAFYIAARNVMIGDVLDFEGDSIADTDETDETTRMGWQFEVSRVEGIEIDGPAIVIYTSGGSFGFPADHEIETLLDSGAMPAFYQCGICDHYHPAGFTGDCRSDAHRFTQSEIEDELGSQWMLTTPDGKAEA